MLRARSGRTPIIECERLDTLAYHLCRFELGSSPTSDALAFALNALTFFMLSPFWPLQQPASLDDTTDDVYDAQMNYQTCTRLWLLLTS